MYLTGVSVHVSAWYLRILRALLSNTVPSLRAFLVCKVASPECNSCGDDCLGANSCAQTPSNSPWEYFTFLTCHACRSSSGTWPSHGSSLSQWLSRGGAYCRVPTPHARIPCELGLSLLELGVWLGNHLSYLLLLSGVPRPEASTPLLCRLQHGHPYPWVSGGDTLLA